MTIDTSGAAAAAPATERGSVTSRTIGTTRESSHSRGLRAVAYTLAAPRWSAWPTKWVPKPPLAPVTSTTASLRDVMSDPLDDGGVREAACLTHDLQSEAAAGLLQVVEQGGRQARPGSAERMPDGDRTAIDVHLGQIGPGLGLPGEHDAREGLVDLKHVDVGDGQTRLRQHLL